LQPDITQHNLSEFANFVGEREMQENLTLIGHAA